MQTIRLLRKWQMTLRDYFFGDTVYPYVILSAVITVSHNKNTTELYLKEICRLWPCSERLPLRHLGCFKRSNIWRRFEYRAVWSQAGIVRLSWGHVQTVFKIYTHTIE